MRVLLIHPYITLTEPKRQYPAEPLGLLYLATYLRDQAQKTGCAIDVRILDAQFEGRERTEKTDRGYRSGLEDAVLRKRIEDYRPALVGIACSYAAHVDDVLEIAETVKLSCNCLLVLGGPHATSAHEGIVDAGPVDVVVRGEGEVTLWEVVQCIRQANRLCGVLGITYKSGGAKFVNPDRPRVSDLDTFPIPDRSLVDYPQYLSRSTNFLTLNAPVGAIVSSRGCPYSCSFCVVPSVWKQKWTARSATNIIKEIEYLCTNYGVREICFLDDQFLGNKQRILDLCNIMCKNTTAA